MKMSEKKKNKIKRKLIGFVSGEKGSISKAKALAVGASLIGVAGVAEGSWDNGTWCDDGNCAPKPPMPPEPYNDWDDWSGDWDDWDDWSGDWNDWDDWSGNWGDWDNWDNEPPDVTDVD